MTRAGLAMLLVLAGCDRPSPGGNTPGARLEAAAVATGAVADPNRSSLVGVWRRDTDRVCIVPGKAAEARIGAAVDYGDGQWCAARGIVRHLGSALRIDFGACRFEATFDGERIAFPAPLPAACASLCRGRATLDALAVAPLSESRSEATALTGPDHRALCVG